MTETEVRNIPQPLTCQVILTDIKALHSLPRLIPNLSSGLFCITRNFEAFHTL